MPLTVREVYGWLDGIAPFATAESFDNVGLLIGDLNATVDALLFCVDITEAVVQEAVNRGAQLIVAHHPLMFGGVTSIDYGTPEGRVLCALMAARLHVIVAHTNWDRAPGGVSDSLGEALGLQGLEAADEYIRVGMLKEPLGADALTEHAAKSLHAHVSRFGEAKEPLSRIAVGGGASGDRAAAAIAAGAQALLVGELKHHELLFACGQGLVVLAAGHFASELVGMEALYRRFQNVAAKNLWQVQPLLYSKAPFWGADLAH